MPAPELNLGDAPHDDNDVQDLWYALEELGFSVGVVGQADYDSIIDVTLPADGEVSIIMRAPGTDSVNGQAISSGQHSLRIEWLDEDDNIMRTEGVYSNREADVWANYRLDPKSPFVRVVLENNTSVDQTATLGGHMR